MRKVVIEVVMVGLPLSVPGLIPGFSQRSEPTHGFRQPRIRFFRSRYAPVSILVCAEPGVCRGARRTRRAYLLSRSLRGRTTRRAPLVGTNEIRLRSHHCLAGCRQRKPRCKDTPHECDRRWLCPRRRVKGNLRRELTVPARIRRATCLLGQPRASLLALSPKR